MSDKSSFTPEEWQVLFTAAPMIGMGVSLASPNGPFGVVKEMFAVGMAISETLQAGSSNPLVRAVIDDMKARGTKPERPVGMDNPESAKRVVLETMKRVNTVLAAKSTPDEAAGFKSWLLTIADKVAQASTEGGFFGIGGERISQAEKQAIAELASALESGIQA
jgi:hypothetical protein